MQSFSRGWQFLKQAWQMAAADKDLIKPSIYTLFAGAIVSMIGIVPMVLVSVLFRIAVFSDKPSFLSLAFCLSLANLSLVISFQR